jgi:hypothetical protein
MCEMNRVFEAALKSSARSEQIWRAVKGNYYLLSAELSIERTSVRASAGRFCVHHRMHLLKELDFGTRKHLEKQRGFLLRLHQAELAKDAGSRAMESSRRNLMASGTPLNKRMERLLRAMWPGWLRGHKYVRSEG